VVDKPESEVRGVVWMMVTARENFVKKSSSTMRISTYRSTRIKWTEVEDLH
jgi:hypothetical protein